MSVLNLIPVASLHNLLDRSEWDVEEIKAFLQRDSLTVNEVNLHLETPLFRVLESENCSIDFVKVLLEYGAEVICRPFDGTSPLMVALSQSRGYAIIEALLKRGFFNGDSLLDSTTLCYGLRCSASKDVIELLLEAGCDPNACGWHVSALSCASDLPNDVLGEGILKLLFNAGAENLLRFDFGQSPVCLALAAGAGAKDIEWLLKQGASLNECRYHEYSVWQCATGDPDSHYERLKKTGMGWANVLRSDVIELLSKEGTVTKSPTDIKCSHAFSALNLAVRMCKYETQAIKILLDFPGVDVSARSYTGNNLLHSAVENCYCEPRVIELLIERGAKVDELNAKNQTPLHTALYSGSKLCKLSVQSSIISILLKNNSPINAIDWEGKTPLRLAVELERHPDIVHILLSAGARIEVPNCGFSLLQFVLNQYLEKKSQFILDSLKLLIKYYFLENPFFKIERLTKWKTTEILATELKHLADECASEVQLMNSMNIGDLVRERSLPKIIATDKNSALSSDSLDNILRIMANNTISHFLADIAATVGKSAMDIKLQELQVYSIKKRPVSSHMEKVILNYDCLRKITSFLTHDDTMRLILAFYNPINQTTSKDSVTNNMIRTSEDLDV